MLPRRRILSTQALIQSLAKLYILGGILLCVIGDNSCPSFDGSLKSVEGGEGAQAMLENLTPFDISFVWVTPQGKEIKLATYRPFQTAMQNTFVGHVFRAWATFSDSEDPVLVMQHSVKKNAPHGGGTASEDSGASYMSIRPCGKLLSIAKAALEKRAGNRKAEYESLVHDQKAPCEPHAQSGKWSCLHLVPSAEYKRRHEWANASLYGFADKKEAQTRVPGETQDTGYVSHIPRMPRITDGPGILKMGFTKKLRELVAFYHEKKNEIHDEQVIAGGYTNNHVVKFGELTLDNHPDVLQMIKDEMWGILRWWTKQELKQSDTYGIRVYRRGAMLINHVDRHETHLASAVLQVGQEVDVDGGWPLEAVNEDGDCYEAYLQPGEMLLYEGARLLHGRPMRLRGESFANAFSHFAPVDFYGLGERVEL